MAFSLSTRPVSKCFCPFIAPINISTPTTRPSVRLKESAVVMCACADIREREECRVRKRLCCTADNKDNPPRLSQFVGPGRCARRCAANFHFFADGAFRTGFIGGPENMAVPTRPTWQRQWDARGPYVGLLWTIRMRAESSDTMHLICDGQKERSRRILSCYKSAELQVLNLGRLLGYTCCCVCEWTRQDGVLLSMRMHVYVNSY